MAGDVTREKMFGAIVAAAETVVDALAQSTPEDQRAAQERRRAVEDSERAAFIAERIAEIPAAERAITEEAREWEDLDRRLVYAERSVSRALDGVLTQAAGGAVDAAVTDGMAHQQQLALRFRSSDPQWNPLRAEGAALLAATDPDTRSRRAYRVALAFVWPDVLRDWRSDSIASSPSYYRVPAHLARGAHRALGAKRHGKAHRLPITWDESQGRVRVTVSLPKGAQIELGAQAKMTTSAADYDEGGALRPDSVLRLIRDVTGPQVALIGHAAFALAQEDSVVDGRPFDGRFWYYPGRVAELLGYSRKSGGAGRIKSETIQRVRDAFAAYAGTMLRQVVKTADGREVTVAGTLLYPTELEASTRTPGKRGRDRETEWRIRDELVALARRHFILMPTHLLHCGDVDPRTWANAMRVYEELAVRFRYSAQDAGAGRAIPVGLPGLASTINLSPRGRTKRSLEIAQLVRFLDLLAARGAITWESGSLADGSPAAMVSLSDPEIRARLAEVGTRADSLSRRGGARRRQASAALP
jgi:PAS domain-containing protein